VPPSPATGIVGPADVDVDVDDDAEPTGVMSEV
jgi:hypothetical protein